MDGRAFGGRGDSTVGAVNAVPDRYYEHDPGRARHEPLGVSHHCQRLHRRPVALFGVDLNRKGASRQTYDASPYIAVQFWIRVEPASPTAVHLAILDMHTDPGGMLCCPTMTDCSNGGNIANGLCYDHFGVDLAPVTTQWTQRTVTFAQLNQVGWGENKVTALDAAHVFNIQFNWLSAAMDIWLDDIYFVKK